MSSMAGGAPAVFKKVRSAAGSSAYRRDNRYGVDMQSALSAISSQPPPRREAGLNVNVTVVHQSQTSGQSLAEGIKLKANS
jgi:hypothetical protein